MPNVVEVTKNGSRHERPLNEATTGVNVPGRDRYQRRRHGEPTPHSYYDLPVINKPVWEAPDIPGYLFLGGLAGAGAVISAAAQLSGRSSLARATKLADAAAAGLSLAALVHDLGRRTRFLNMLRVFKVTSPMSVGSWLLAGFAPAAAGSALSEMTGLFPSAGAVATAGAAALGPAVACYTAALISNTAVPAWHDGHTHMPFVFASSAVASAAGFGLIAAPVTETGPLKGLGAMAGLAEVALTKAMERKTGLAREAYHEGKARKLMRASERLLLSGACLTLLSGRHRAFRAAGGAALFAGSLFTRFGIFEAGLASAEDPKYTVTPQRERLAARENGK